MRSPASLFVDTGLFVAGTVQFTLTLYSMILEIYCFAVAGLQYSWTGQYRILCACVETSLIVGGCLCIYGKYVLRAPLSRRGAFFIATGLIAFPYFFHPRL